MNPRLTVDWGPTPAQTRDDPAPPLAPPLPPVPAARLPPPTPHSRFLYAVRQSVLHNRTLFRLFHDPDLSWAGPISVLWTAESFADVDACTDPDDCAACRVLGTSVTGIGVGCTLDEASAYAKSLLDDVRGPEEVTGHWLRAIRQPLQVLLLDGDPRGGAIVTRLGECLRHIGDPPPPPPPSREDLARTGQSP